jgi:tetratricopeptide (TPR) repeat protein
MLGFSRRKQGKLRSAIQAYYSALDRKPNFPEAREYLGEAYLQAAKHQLETIAKDHGRDHDDYKKLRTSFLQIIKQISSSESNGSTGKQVY